MSYVAFLVWICLNIVVELEVHRGTVSAIQRSKMKKHEDDTHSVISEEDLQEYDEEYKLLWAKKPGEQILLI